MSGGSIWIETSKEYDKHPKFGEHGTTIAFTVKLYKELDLK